jgi:uncharacterized protein (DUF2141 family)
VHLKEYDALYPNRYCCGTEFGNDWELDLHLLDSAKFEGSNIKAWSIRTIGQAGDSVAYYDVEPHYVLEKDTNLNVTYHNIYAMGRGLQCGSDYDKGIFRGGFIAENVILEAYKFFTFENDSVYIVTNTFTTTGAENDCGLDDITTIQGNSAATRTVFNVANYDLVRARIKNINSTPNPMYVTAGIDDGNNENVTVDPVQLPPGRDFYWVGGDGYWLQGSLHWSIGVSGGNPAVTNPYGCVPTKNDNVIFDINSFVNSGDRVRIDNMYGKFANCYNMTWKPEARGGIIGFYNNNNSTLTLNVYGSLELAAESDFHIRYLYMKGVSDIEDAQTISFNGITEDKYRVGYIYFDGGGRYDILDNLGYEITNYDDLNNYTPTTYVQNGSKLHLNTSETFKYLVVDNSSSFYSHGNTVMVYNFTVNSGSEIHTIDLSQSTVTVNNTLNWNTGANTTTTIEDATINLLGSSSFTFTEGCNWNSTNSHIVSSENIRLNYDGITPVQFNKITMTGTTATNTVLGYNGTGTGPFNFNRVEFTGLYSFLDNASSLYTFDTLIYRESSTNQIRSGKQINIADQFVAVGTPCAAITVVSGTAYQYYPECYTPVAPAIIKSVNCEPLYIYFGIVNNLTADISDGCPPETYRIHGDSIRACLPVNYNNTNWMINQIDRSSVKLLGRDTVIDCRTPLPYIQTSEGFGLGKIYTWYYRPNKLTKWTTLPETGPNLAVTVTGYYSLRVNYGTACFLGDTLRVGRYIRIDQELPPAVITKEPDRTHITCTYPEIMLTGDKSEDPTGTLFSYVWKDQLNNILGNDQTYTATTANTYSVIITRQRNYCVDSTSVVLTLDQIHPQAVINGNPDITVINCADLPVTVTANDNLSYHSPNYEWNAGLGTANISEDINYPGNYYVVISYVENGCTDTARVVVHTDPKISIGTVEVTQEPICATDNGEIRFYINGVSTGYEYKLYKNNTLYRTGASSSPIVINNLSAGSYRIKVWDNTADCYVVESDEILLENQNSNLSVTATPVNATTCGSSDGYLLVNASGGSIPYTAYNLYDAMGILSNTLTSGAFTNLPAGDYIVEVIDDDGCSAFTEVRIGSNAYDATITVTNIVPTVCGNSVGEAILNIFSSSTYRYQLDGFPEAGPFTGAYQINLSDLPAGEHNVRVFGSCGEITETFIIPNDAGMLMASAEAVPVQRNCDGTLTKGFILLTVTGGSGSYEYNIGDGWTPLSAPYQIPNLYEGDYLVEIRDNNNCLYNINNVKINREEATPITFGTVYTVKNPVCNLMTKGSVQFYVTGGSGAYEYDLYFNNGSMPLASGTYTDGLISNLSAGSYRIEVRDVNFSCLSVMSTEIVLRDSLSDLAVNVTVTPANTCIANDGILEVAVTGGVNHQYFMDGVSLPSSYYGEPFITVNSVSTGVHTISVTDGFCTASSGEFTVTSRGTDMEVVVNDVISTVCGTNNGAIRFSVTTSSNAYYQLNNGQIEDAHSTMVINNLYAGEHLLHIFDDCGGDTLISVVITNGTDALLFTSVVRNEMEACDGEITSGKITLTAENGIAPYQYRIDGGSWINFTNGNETEILHLSQGLYFIEVQDAEGCIYRQNLIEIDIELARRIRITSIYVVDNPTCTTTGSIQVHATGGTGEYDYSINGRPFEVYPDGLITGLTADTYVIVVRDTNNVQCPFSVSQPVTLINIKGLTLYVESHEPADCNSKGALTAITTHGEAPYAYWLNDVLQTTIPDSIYQFSNLSVGTYRVKVVDNTGCVVTEEVFLGAALSGLTLNIQNVKPNEVCGGNDGEVTFTVTGNNKDYTYQLNSLDVVGPLTHHNPITLYDLSAGIHTLRIFDSCKLIVQTFTVPNLASDLSVDAVPQNVKIFCDGDILKGNITLTAIGGTPPYSYRIVSGGAWNSFTNDITTVIPNLNLGYYYVEVKDEDGCTFGQWVEINKEGVAPVIIGTMFIASNPTCTAPGSIRIYATGGSGEYQYSINGGVFEDYANGLITGLTAGSYRIEVRDRNSLNCSTALSQELLLRNDHNGLSVTAIPVNPVNCSSLGSLLVSVTGNEGAMYYTALNGDDDVPLIYGVYENLPTGVYVVSVFDATGCTATSEEVRITVNTPALLVNITGNIATGCGDNTGSITFNVSGSSAYRYQLNNTELSGLITHNNPITVSNLSAGNHILRVFDRCAEVIKPFTIANNTGGALTATAISQNEKELCNLLAPGEIYLTATGGTAPYFYRIDGGIWKQFIYSHSDTIRNLTQGVYYIEVKDNNPCTFENHLIRIKKEIGEPLFMGTVAVVAQPACATAGVVQVNVTGGSGIYEYSVNGDVYQSYSNGLITGLTAGTYHIDVRDAVYTFCPTVSSQEIVLHNTGTGLAVSLFAVNASACDAGDGELYITVTGGNGPFKYELSKNHSPFTEVFPVNGKLSLGVGVYAVKVTDLSTPYPYCVAGSDEIRIGSDGSAINISYSYVVNNATCRTNDGAIGFIVAGSSNYYYQLDNLEVVGPVTTNGLIVISDLTSGEHLLQVFDTCGIVTQTIIVPNSGYDLAVTATPQNRIKYCDEVTSGSITLNVTGGEMPYFYTINDGATWTRFVTETYIINNLTEGSYFVQVKDTTGCIYRIYDVTVSQEAAEPVIIGSVHAVTQPTCGNTDGSIQLYVTGGSGEYEYRYRYQGNTITSDWFPYTNGLISGLREDAYTIQVKDKNHPACAAAEVGTITLHSTNNTLNLTVVPVDAATCDSQGKLLVSTTGGSGHYRYTVYSYATGISNVYNNPLNGTVSVSPGDYEVSVYDMTLGGCMVYSGKVSIHATAAPTLSLTITDTMHTTCGETVGAVRFTVENTATPYYYQLDNFPPVTVSSASSVIFISGLSAGEHIIRLYDNCGEIEKRFTVNNSDNALSLTATPENRIQYCNTLTDGKIVITASGGRSPYAYRLDSENWIPFSGNSATITVAEGIYFVEVKDADSCIYHVNRVEVSMEISEPLVFGSVYVVAEPTCTSNGSIQFNVTGGSGSYEYIVNNNLPYQPYTNGLLSNLTARNYTIRVRDVNYQTCSPLETFILLPNIDNLDLTVIPSNTTSCGINNGIIYVRTTGGIGTYS